MRVSCKPLSQTIVKPIIHNKAEVNTENQKDVSLFHTTNASHYPSKTATNDTNSRDTCQEDSAAYLQLFLHVLTFVVNTFLGFSSPLLVSVFLSDNGYSIRFVNVYNERSMKLCSVTEWLMTISQCLHDASVSFHNLTILFLNHLNSCNFTSNILHQCFTWNVGFTRVVFKSEPSCLENVHPRSLPAVKFGEILFPPLARAVPVLIKWPTKSFDFEGEENCVKCHALDILEDFKADFDLNPEAYTHSFENPRDTLASLEIRNETRLIYSSIPTSQPGKKNKGVFLVGITLGPRIEITSKESKSAEKLVQSVVFVLKITNRLTKCKDSLCGRLKQKLFLSSRSTHSVSNLFPSHGTTIFFNNGWDFPCFNLNTSSSVNIHLQCICQWKQTRSTRTLQTFVSRLLSLATLHFYCSRISGRETHRQKLNFIQSLQRDFPHKYTFPCVSLVSSVHYISGSRGSLSDKGSAEILELVPLQDLTEHRLSLISLLNHFCTLLLSVCCKAIAHQVLVSLAFSALREETYPHSNNVSRASETSSEVTTMGFSVSIIYAILLKLGAHKSSRETHGFSTILSKSSSNSGLFRYPNLVKYLTCKEQMKV